ncbi:MULTISPECIES: hypothetical protein [unclassified Undibacterium]|uniref:hypothetical protein n=1 Tax=unclassified Undibacterium TaxID=2630295 RepID=UPI002B236FB6|nr:MULTISPECIES: hypothetical protein [unclassified Undibacterium]
MIFFALASPVAQVAAADTISVAVAANVQSAFDDLKFDFESLAHPTYLVTGWKSR